MADNDDSGGHPRKTYYTNVPGWAAKQVEDYIEETGFSNSKAVAKLVQKGLRDQTLAERVINQLITIPITSLAILAMVWTWANIGGFIGLVTQTNQALASAYFIMLGPSMIAIAAIATLLMYTGWAKKIGDRLREELVACMECNRSLTQLSIKTND